MKNLLAFLSIIALTISFGMFTSTVYGENRAISLDGDGDYVLIGDPVPTSLQIQKEITLEAWIYVTRYPPSNTLGLIVGSQNDSKAAGATIFLDGRTNPDGQPSPAGHIHFQIADGSWHTTNVNAQVPLNQWVHISATRKANESAKVYYNGVLQPSTSVAWSGSVSYTGAWFAIGKQKDSGNRDFNGIIDDVRIWNIARKESEIRATMNRSLTGNETGFAGYWKFDEASGDKIAHDSTPNGNDGTLYGDATFVASDAPIFDVSPDPEIWLSTDNLIFCKTAIGEYDELPVTIMNIGQADLEVTDIVSDNANFTAAPTNFTLAYLESQEVLVRFTPTAEAVETGTLTITSNAPDATISLTGEGVSFLNRAVIFDGNGDYVEFMKDIPETNLTVEFWFRTTSANGGLFAVQLSSLGSGGHDRHVYIENGYLKQRVWSNEVITSAHSGFNDGAWHHYVMVIEQGIGQKMWTGNWKPPEAKIGRILPARIGSCLDIPTTKAGSTGR